MNPAVLKELQLQANYPRGIAARVDSADLKRLLEERAALLAALDDASGEPMCDYCRVVGEGRYPQDCCEYNCRDRQQAWWQALTFAKADAP